MNSQCEGLVFPTHNITRFTNGGRDTSGDLVAMMHRMCRSPISICIICVYELQKIYKYVVSIIFYAVDCCLELTAFLLMQSSIRKVDLKTGKVPISFT